MTNFDRAYLKLVLKILLFGHKNNNTIELLNTKIKIKDISKPVLNIRNISRRYMLEELYNFFTARNDLESFRNASEFWCHCSDDNETINSAYGYIILKKYYNQINQVIDILSNDITSRRAVINISVPDTNRKNTNDEECTLALHFMVHKGKLNLTVYMRSNDLYFGLPYDVTFFIMLQQYISKKLHLDYGSYTHISTSSHIYLRDINKFKVMFKNIIFNSYIKQEQFSYFELPLIFSEFGKETFDYDIETL